MRRRSHRAPRFCSSRGNAGTPRPRLSFGGASFEGGVFVHQPHGSSRVAVKDVCSRTPLLFEFRCAAQFGYLSGATPEYGIRSI
jgi:hypothetical protein